ncbi:MAG: hypothetical protein JWP56_3150 [Aeromicrobium sp.]|nr:hypothetical protein [Aeromicrobium sp.]
MKRSQHDGPHCLACGSPIPPDDGYALLDGRRGLVGFFHDRDECRQGRRRATAADLERLPNEQSGPLGPFQRHHD